MTIEFRYLRFRIFQTFKAPFSRRSRLRRMQQFASFLTRPIEELRILDLGGTPKIWECIPEKLNLTLLNLPGTVESNEPSHHNLSYVEGDACDVNMFGDREFDLVFSNSVIEHVGGEAKQRAFAAEVSRLGRAYWVQTPSLWFPIEAHCGMPFWWFYPSLLRRRLIDRWRRKLPAWAEMVDETRVLTRTTIRRLFPDARILSERACGFTKSYVAWRADS